jgi:hypothetical protein
MNKIKIWWSADHHKSLFFALFYALLPLVQWLQLTLSHKQFSNNFRIFRHSFFHLSNHQRLYIEYPSEYWDYFFYHPVFAFLFAPFAVLPENMGLFLWIAFLTFVFYKATMMMPFRKGFLWLFFYFNNTRIDQKLRSCPTQYLELRLNDACFYLF